MAKAKEKSVQLINLDNFKIEQLPELNGKKEEVKAELSKFPSVKIIDNETYELAKKSRTGVKTIRTGLEKEESMVVKKIKENILGTVISGYAEIKKDVLAIETKYQAEVTAWEDIKKKEKEARDLAEQQRVDGIRNKINEFVNTWESEFSSLNFECIQECKVKFEISVDVINSDRELLQEFSLLFDKKVDDLRNIFNSKVVTLTEQENLRLERIKLDEEKAETKRIQDIKDNINSWYNKWTLNIGNLTFSEISNFRKTLQEEEPLLCQEFQSEFGEKRAQIVSLLTHKIQQLETAETQRIAHEKFLAEKKEFEEKQLAEQERQELNLHNERSEILLPYWDFVLEQDKDRNWGKFDETTFNSCLEMYKERKEKSLKEVPLVPEECFEEKGIFGMDPISKIEENDVLLVSDSENKISHLKLKDLDFVMVLKQLITDTPNDSELGRIVRQMANE